MMKKERIKVYIYTRVSTAMQIDGYSLDAQKSRMKAFADFNDYEIVGEYEDAGKSGKSIEGRIQFNQMMEDIKSGKDGVSYVLVFKLSRFGRNAADVLSTLQVMQDFGADSGIYICNFFCVKCSCGVDWNGRGHERGDALSNCRNFSGWSCRSDSELRSFYYNYEILS